MNVTLTIIVCLVCLGIGWAIGTNNTNKRLDAIDSAIDFIEESSEVLSINSMLLIKAEEEIILLRQLKNQNYKIAEQQLVESLNSYYQGIQETISDGMANEKEIEFTKRIESLAKEDELFEVIIEQGE